MTDATAVRAAAVRAKARELAPRLRSVFLVGPEEVDGLPEGVEYAVIGSRHHWRVLARAKYLVDNADFADAVVKRPRSVHLQTQHGTPPTSTCSLKITRGGIRSPGPGPAGPRSSPGSRAPRRTWPLDTTDLATRSSIITPT